jgi:hypothetical protein
MNDLIDSVKKSLQDKNWYAALTLTLTLPDICGNIDYPKSFSKKRYAKWFDKYVKSKYTFEIGAKKKLHTFLNGSDCYALRCSYLHEGTSITLFQKSHELLEDFLFVKPPPTGKVHLNQIDKKLQLQVDLFCTDIVESIKSWLFDIKEDKVKMEKLTNLLRIFEIC